MNKNFDLPSQWSNDLLYWHISGLLWDQKTVHSFWDWYSGLFCLNVFCNIAPPQWIHRRLDSSELSFKHHLQDSFPLKLCFREKMSSAISSASLWYWHIKTFFRYKRLLHTQSTAVPLKNPNQQNKGGKKKKKGTLTDCKPLLHPFPSGISVFATGQLWGGAGVEPETLLESCCVRASHRQPCRLGVILTVVGLALQFLFNTARLLLCPKSTLPLPALPASCFLLSPHTNYFQRCWLRNIYHFRPESLLSKQKRRHAFSIKL